MVRKVGRTTGQTLGAVTATNVNEGEAGYTLLWQFEASMYADLGDSGSPVFQKWNGDQTNHDVILNGVFWGFYDDGQPPLGQRISVWSSINYIRFQGELPGIQFCATSAC